MMRFVKQSIRKLLLDRNIPVSKATDIRISDATPRKKLLDFLLTVRPYETNRHLIRLGGDGDGGYLIPDDIEGIQACFSPGVSNRARFEEDLARKGIRCFLADYSVDAPPIENDLFDFSKKYLGPSDSDVFITLENWVKQKAPHKDEFILQMDVEGAEYGVILDTSSETLRKFRILVVEFHGLDALCDRLGYELINLAFSKILKHFEVVHIHPNNFYKPTRYRDILIPPVMEFSFLRKDRVSVKQLCRSFPHHLDNTNVPANEDFVLPMCWYGNNEFQQ